MPQVIDVKGMKGSERGGVGGTHGTDSLVGGWAPKKGGKRFMLERKK